jgi:DNA-binding beta-propeller fold protein YncE
LPGDSRLGCISGDTDVGPTGSGLCSLTPDAGDNAEGSGLSNIDEPRISPDGKNAYAIRPTGVVTFNRNAGTGALSFAGCVSGAISAADPCGEIPGATIGGENSGFDGASELAISPDGKNVYVVTLFDSAVLTFDRSPATGQLSFVECHSGETASAGVCGNPNNGGTNLKTTTNGMGTGLSDADALAVRPDGTEVWVTSRGDDALTRFDRNPATGKIAFSGCITGNDDFDGGDPCEASPFGTTPNGDDSGFGGLSSLAFSPDGLNLYATAQTDHGLLAFSDNAGELEFERCVTGDLASGSTGNSKCLNTPGATASGEGSELEFLNGATVAPDGLDVYVTLEDGVAHFTRGLAPPNVEKGGPAWGDCLSSLPDSPCDPTPTVGDEAGLSGASELAVSPDNQQVYVATGYFVEGDKDGLTTLDRNQATGGLAFRSCLSADTGAGPAGSGACGLIPGASEDAIDTGLSSAFGLGISPDGRHVYLSGVGDSAINWFGDLRDTRVSGARVKAKRKQKQRRRILVRVSARASEGVTAVVTGSILARGNRRQLSAGSSRKRTYALKRAKKQLPGGNRKTIKLRLSRKKLVRRVLRALRRGARVKAKLRVRLTDSAGNTLVRKRSVTLR